MEGATSSPWGRRPEGAAGGGSPLLPSSRGDCVTRHGLGESSSNDALDSWMWGWKFVSARVSADPPHPSLSSTFDFHLSWCAEPTRCEFLSPDHTCCAFPTRAVIFLPASRLRLSLLAGRMHRAGCSTSELRLWQTPGSRKESKKHEAHPSPPPKPENLCYGEKTGPESPSACAVLHLSCSDQDFEAMLENCGVAVAAAWLPWAARGAGGSRTSSHGDRVGIKLI